MAQNFVSIPFKRETPTKPSRRPVKAAYIAVFQFPSSGKLLPNRKLSEPDHSAELVSIPFKRETPTKLIYFFRLPSR